MSLLCLFLLIQWINISTLVLKVRSDGLDGLFQLISLFLHKFARMYFFLFPLQLLQFWLQAQVSVWSCTTWTAVTFTQVFQPAFIWAFFFFFFATHIYFLPMCCINSFEEEYHFEDERAAVLLCKQTRQKFETGKCTYKELCFIDEPFRKESILKAPKPLIPPAQRVECVDVWMYILFIYLLLSRLRLIVWVWVSLHTQSPSSHHTVAHGYLYCVCVCFFLLKRTLINSP